MPRKRPDAQWIFATEDEARAEDGWCLAANRKQADANTLQTDTGDWQRRGLWRIAVVLLLIVVGAGMWLWRVADEGLQNIDQEVQTAIEVDAWRNRYTGTGNAVVVPPSRATVAVDVKKTDGERPAIEHTQAGSTVTLQELTFHGALAVASVVLTLTNPVGEQKAYREFYFYRQEEGEWVRTALDATYWGRPQTLESVSFTFHYRHRDAATIAAVAAELDMLYQIVRDDFGVPAPTEKLVIEIDADAPLQTSIFARFYAGRLRLASPSLFSVPVELSEREVLMPWLVDALVRQVLDEVEPRFGGEWWHVDNALREWQVRAYNPLAAAWHDDLLRWIVAASEQKHTLASLTAHLHQLCAKHWVEHQIQFIAPGAASTQVCVTRSDSELIRLATEGPPLRLTATQVDMTHLTKRLQLFPVDGTGPNWSWLDTAVLVTLFDYVALTYGRDHVPALVRASHHHQTWESLIPALFAIPAEEFEAGWLAYLGGPAR